MYVKISMLVQIYLNIIELRERKQQNLNDAVHINIIEKRIDYLCNAYIEKAVSAMDIQTRLRYANFLHKNPNLCNKSKEEQLLIVTDFLDLHLNLH